MTMLRRDFLKLVVAGAATAVTAPVFSNDFPLVLWAKRGKDQARVDCSTPEGHSALCYLLRDVRANVKGHPHPALVRLLCWEQAWLAAYGVHAPFVFTSGLRMPATNASTEGAAQASHHLPDENYVFRAVDMHSPVVSTDYLSRLAYLARQGGIGIYTSKNFLHQDVGRVRVWRG